MIEQGSEEWRQVRFHLKNSLLSHEKSLVEIAQVLNLSEVCLVAYLFKGQVPERFHFQKLKAYVQCSAYRQKGMISKEKISEENYWHIVFQQDYEQLLTRVESGDLEQDLKE